MNIYTSYLTGDIENINVDTINDLIRTNTYTCPRALTALANIVKPAVLNNHQRK